jgi:hypothetical protein
MDPALERMPFGHEKKGITKWRLVSFSKFMFEGGLRGRTGKAPVTF